MDTGRKILNLRYDRKISQQDLAATCDITPSALSKIEAGKNTPGAVVIWGVAQALGVSVEYLMDETIPYPYVSHTYQHGLLEEGKNPTSSISVELTLEEKKFIEALRKVHRVAQEVAYSVPSASLETIRLIHFLLNHATIDNPSQNFLRDFESLVTTGKPVRHPPQRPDGRAVRQRALAEQRKALTEKAEAKTTGAKKTRARKGKGSKATRRKTTNARGGRRG